jgi:hypothetical protein
MTVVVAAKGVGMAFDCGSSNNWLIVGVSTPKAWRQLDGSLIGSSGSWLAINALREMTGGTPRAAATVIANLPPKQIKGTEVLIAPVTGPLVVIDADGAIVELRSSFYAIGSGADFALGYLEGCIDPIGPEELLKAVKIAAKYAPGVMLPARGIGS